MSETVILIISIVTCIMVAIQGMVAVYHFEYLRKRTKKIDKRFSNIVRALNSLLAEVTVPKQTRGSFTDPHRPPVRSTGGPIIPKLATVPPQVFNARDGGREGDEAQTVVVGGARGTAGLARREFGPGEDRSLRAEGRDLGKTDKSPEPNS